MLRCNAGYGTTLLHGLVGLLVTVGVLAFAAPAVASSFGVANWGENEAGQLGDGTTTGSDVPVPVTGLNGATAVAGEGQGSIALLDVTVKTFATSPLRAAGQFTYNSPGESQTEKEATFATTKSKSVAEAVAREHGGLTAAAGKHGIKATTTSIRCAQVRAQE